MAHKDSSLNARKSAAKPILRLPRLVLGAATTVVVVVGCMYASVEADSRDIYRRAQDVPKTPVAIVFGAGIGTPVLKDRVSTAVALYRAGRVQKLLMTGDNAHLNYDEPEAMKSLAVAAGVPSSDIVCDYAGFRTYDSLYRARDIFDVRQATLVTQAFHLPRAMFLARRLGLSVVGIDASLRDYGASQFRFNLREVGAVATAWMDVLTNRQPKFLGKKEPLFAARPGSAGGQ